jgi:hypothetical protein
MLFLTEVVLNLLDNMYLSTRPKAQNDKKKKLEKSNHSLSQGT